MSKTQQHKQDEYIGWAFEGGKVVANYEADRLQIHFDESPGETILADVKSWGFKWDRSISAWYRKLTTSAVFAASQIEAICPADGSNPVTLQPKYQKFKERQSRYR